MAARADHVVTRRGILRMAGLGAAALGGVALTSACGTAAIPGASGEQKLSGAGGLLRVGIVGGSAKDSLDAHMPLTHPDEARVINLYDTLASFDEHYEIKMALAESIEPNKTATAWTIRLRPGMLFSNGQPVTAQDVVHTIQRITDPKNPMPGAIGFSSVDAKRMQVLDNRTVRLNLTAPDVTILDSLAGYASGIVPVGYDPKHPIGAGPFKLSSFQPGQQSVFVRNEHYWRPGEPKLDELVIIDFTDDTARVNALLGGQVDAVDQLPLSLLNVVGADPGLRVLEAHTGAWTPFTMRCDRPPFNDVRVRQAFRLIADRQQIIDQALDGHGVVANDLYAPFDPDYNRGLPQRKQNIAEARALLKAAGKENLTVELVTSNIAAGVIEAATVFVNQAKEAGVTVTLRQVDSGVFYGANYLKWDFAQDFWFTRNFLPQVSNSSIPGAPYNETHFDDPEFTALVKRARATLDPARRRALIHAAQQIEYERGGYIIWGFANQVDAYNARLTGLVPDRSGIPLSGYNFRKVSFRS